jgi:hypothetical protein
LPKDVYTSLVWNERRTFRPMSLAGRKAGESSMPGSSVHTRETEAVSVVEAHTHTGVQGEAPTKFPKVITLGEKNSTFEVNNPRGKKAV